MRSTRCRACGNRVLVPSAQDDPLLTATRDAAAVLPDGTFEELPGYADASFTAVRRDTIQRFLGQTV